MTTSEGAPATEPAAFPMRPVASGMAAMVLLLSVSTMLTWKIGDQIRDRIETQIEVLNASQKVAHYGDVLELTIKAVVANGDRLAADRYRAVQPELRKTLNRLRGTVQLEENIIAARRVDRADLALIAIEYQALGLATAGHVDEAQALTNSRKYDHLLGIYQQGVRGIEERSRAYVSAANEELHWYLRVSLGLSLAAFALVGLAWLLLIRPARKWGDQLDTARAKAESAAQQLEEQKKDLRMINRKLFDQARIDPLTKLNTRLRLSEDLEMIAARVARYGEGYCAVMCDIDYFKQYNDTYGHPAGDEVLRSVANALAESCRGGDQVYRYGGEEFLLIMPTVSLEGAQVGAERHRASVQALSIPHDGSPRGILTISMGLAVLRAGSGEAVSAWLKEADSALYQAKRAGRNRVVTAAAKAQV